MRGDQHLERRPFVAGEEPVQRLGVLADVVVDVHEGVARRFELGERPRRDDDLVPDPADLDQHRAVEGTLEHDAAQRTDHAR